MECVSPIPSVQELPALFSPNIHHQKQWHMSMEILRRPQGLLGCQYKCFILASHLLTDHTHIPLDAVYILGGTVASAAGVEDRIGLQVNKWCIIFMPDRECSSLNSRGLPQFCPEMFSYILAGVGLGNITKDYTFLMTNLMICLGSSLGQKRVSVRPSHFGNG